MKKSVSGYVLILMTALIPVLLFGTKYILDLRTVNKVPTEKGNQEWHKHCAKEAALAVARNWNPGLTLEQQKAAVYKVADAVYSASPFSNGSAIRRAIPGLDVKTSQIENQNDGTSNPLKVQYVIEEVPENPIKYNYVERYRNQNSVSDSNASWNPNYKLWSTIDQSVSDLSKRHSEYDEMNKTELKKGNFVLKHHDICENPSITLPAVTELCATYEANGKYYPNNSNYSYNSNLSNYVTDELADAAGNTPSIPEDEEIDFTKRQTVFGAGPVRVSLENDQIKVETDADSGKNYPGTVATAVPAQCNVDIVLAIPVNGAASNENNKDAASDIAENPVNSTISQNIQDTPIYQMGQACKDFVKKFYHTRGVTMGLIPYSAKISVSPDRYSGYTAAISSFSESYFQNYPLATKKMCGAALYGTNGDKSRRLSAAYSWGTEITVYPIMCRQGSTSTLEDYGNNSLFRGNLLSNEEPTTSELKYRRMNLNPCYLGYANMLSMHCDNTCKTYLPNPYYMIEPTADLVKIYEMCNTLYPFYDTQNVSNFIFIPFEWANNFFQGWTENVEKSATNNQLSVSKIIPARKKALILLVNKPDWFEPGELTYIGFDNDYSDIPTYESDKIDFSIDYDDADKKFLDGSNFNTNHTSGLYTGINNKNTQGTGGLIAGPKKILRFETTAGKNPTMRNGYYEIDSGTYRLKFPHKGLVKLVVAPATAAEAGVGLGQVTFYSNNITDGKKSTSDIRKDSTSVTKISLNSAQTITGSQEFVFSGGTMPPKNSVVQKMTINDVVYNNVINSTQGSNFSHNLSVKKVKYSLTNAVINSCILKNQIIRGYWGYYGVEKGNSCKILILNNGRVARKVGNDGYTYSGYRLTNDGRQGNNTLETTNQFSDSCLVNDIQSTGYSIGWIYLLYKSRILNSTVYGVTSDYVLSVNGDVFIYKGSSSISGRGMSTRSWGEQKEFSNNSSDNIVLTFKGVANSDTWYHLCQLYIQNLNDKEFKGTIYEDPIVLNDSDSATIYPELDHNEGVYLAEFENSSGVKENWICFQGDGELHVNVTAGSGIKFNNVSNRPISGVESISKTETIYIDPENIFNSKEGDDYYIEFEAGALKLISAEITNREYEEIDPECALIGTTNALNGTGTAYILTNVKEKMHIKARPSEGGTITFYSNNITDGKKSTSDIRKDSTSVTKISLNSAQTITGSQEFVFSGGTMPPKNSVVQKMTINDVVYNNVINSTQGSNFSHNLSVKKVKYSLTNAVINSCILKNQIIRGYWGYYGVEKGNSCKILILNNGRVARKVGNDGYTYSGYRLTNDGRQGNNTLETTNQFSDSCLVNDIQSTGYSIGWIYLLYKSRILNSTVYGVTSDYVLSVNGDVFIYKGSSSISGRGMSTRSWGEQKEFSNNSSDNIVLTFKGVANSDTWYHLCQLYIQNLNDKEFKGTIYEDPIVLNDSDSATIYPELDHNEGVYLAEFENSSGVKENWICFQGDGELHVTVAETPVTGYINHLNKDQEQTQTEVIGTSTYQTLSIDPDHYHYESNADGSLYVVKLDLENLELDTEYGVQFAEPQGKIRRYKKIEHTENNNRYINYANSSGAVYESSVISGSFSTFYNSLNQTQSIFSGSNDYNKISNISPRVFWGDISHIMEDQATFAPYINLQLGDHGGDFYVPGTTRLFTPIWRETVNKYLSITEKSGAEGTDTKKGGVLDLLTTNLTYPLNYVLAMGGFQNMSNGVPTDTPTQAAAKATKAVCDNLKQSYDSDNLRIYVIKYRKQNKYKDLLTQSEGTHVYNYLDQCASGTSAPYLHDVSTKTELENALTAIAKDIKENFAGYTDAKAFNVEQ